MVTRDSLYKEKIEKIENIIRSIKEQKEISNELLLKKYKDGQSLIEEVTNLVEDGDFKVETIG